MEVTETNQRPIKFSDRETLAHGVVELRKIQLKSGVLGRAFGTSLHVSSHIAGLVVLIVLIPNMIATFACDQSKSAEAWRATDHVLSIALGFLFGKSVVLPDDRLNEVNHENKS